MRILWITSFVTVCVVRIARSEVKTGGRILLAAVAALDVRNVLFVVRAPQLIDSLPLQNCLCHILAACPLGAQTVLPRTSRRRFDHSRAGLSFLLSHQSVSINTAPCGASVAAAPLVAVPSMNTPQLRRRHSTPRDNRKSGCRGFWSCATR